MATITVKNPAGKSAGDVDLHDDVFGITPNVPVMHQVVTAQLAARRAGTQSTKTRSEVRGGGAKPYRQKGTGRARQGSTNAPHFAGGGIALGPKPRSYSQRTPKKMIRLALRSALSDRAREDRIVVVDAWGWDTPSTKQAADALGALGVDGRVLVVIERDDATAALSFRNIPEVQIIHSNELNAYDVLCNDWIVFSSASLSVLFSGSALEAPGGASGRSGSSPQADAVDPVVTSDDAADTDLESEDPVDDVVEAGVGSASEQPEAARGQSEAEADPAAEGSASEQPEAARGQSEAEAEPAMNAEIEPAEEEQS